MRAMRAELKSLYSAKIWAEFVDFMSDEEVARNLRLAHEAKRREG